MRSFRNAAGCSILLAALNFVVLAQTCLSPGCLDETFGGGDGKVAYPNPLVVAWPGDIAVQSDGKVVSLTGPRGGPDSTYSLIRIHVDGSLDTSFNGTGTRSFQWGFSFRNGWYFGYVRAIGVQTINDEERIVVAGQAPKLNGNKVQNFLRVDRFKPDGSTDTGFGTNGSVYLSVGQAYDIEIQPDQKIVGVTIGNSKIFRLNANGSLDTGFGSSGVVTGNGALQKLVLDTDGSIFVASQISSGRGSSAVHTIEVRKYDSYGELDTSFGVGGAAKFALSNYSFLPKSITIDSLHNVLVGTRAWVPNQDIAAVRFTQNGVVDTTFGANGIFLGGYSANDARVSSALMTSDGKIILVGDINNLGSRPNDAIVTRLNYDGSIDPTFGNGGSTTFRNEGYGNVSGGKGGLIQVDPSCSCEKILVAAGNDYLTLFARLNTL